MARRHPKPTPAQIAGRALRQSADVIEDRGWKQGTMGEKKRGFCTVGAIFFTQSGSFKQTPVSILACDELSRWLGENGYVTTPAGSYSESHQGRVMQWNDEKNRSKDEVVSVLRKAADDLDPQSW